MLGRQSPSCQRSDFWVRELGGFFKSASLGEDCEESPLFEKSFILDKISGIPSSIYFMSIGMLL